MERIDDKIMEQRRRERLKRLCFFMLDPKVPDDARRTFTLNETHLLLRGFFSNSHWQTAWWCVKRATYDSWVSNKMSVQIWWWRKVRGLSRTQIEEKLMS